MGDLTILTIVGGDQAISVDSTLSWQVLGTLQNNETYRNPYFLRQKTTLMYASKVDPIIYEHNQYLFDEFSAWKR